MNQMCLRDRLTLDRSVSGWLSGFGTSEVIAEVVNGATIVTL